MLRIPDVMQVDKLTMPKSNKEKPGKSKMSSLVAQPLYRMAENEMLRRIANKVWVPGQQLPNEFILAEEFNISQGTIRKALTSLEKKGLLVRHPGRGTMVARTTQEEVLFAFFRLRDGNANIVTPQTLSEDLRRRKATKYEYEILAPKCEEVYQLKRVRHNQDRPFVLEDMVFSAKLCDGLEDNLPLPSSLYPYLNERWGITVMSVQESVAAVAADADVAEALSVANGTPLLRVERRALDLGKQIIEVRRSHYLTSFATYQVELNRWDSSSE
ncbi:GntR family transcriptional regulator [uncultured Thalassospira sp.]|jgi:GntR family transcriptional regulator|uniref:GntR family transcriptional regulator n=1 Tax=uncultured Thalassospira sp. TaxID=404382 RepID=UPI0030D992D5|tara:strand:+ start:1959 stop:2774 length:816 start_codon:yes stop_codon:yes gene_type:complete